MFNIMRNTKKIAIIPVVIIIIGIVCLFINGGFATDIDFSGGTMMQINMGKDFKLDDVTNVIKESTGKDVAVIQYASDSNAEHQVLFKMETLSKDARDKLFEDIKTKFSLDDKALMASDNITPLVSSEIIYNALLAVVIAVILILIYITIRFTFASGVAAVCALIHDVLIMLSFYAIFRVATNASFIAALLTIIGYSINDTIVIFDRVRENKKYAKKGETFVDTCEKSIWQSMRRTINTSGTTLLALIVLTVLGSSSIREFSVPLIVGVVTGTFSSAFIAAPIWALLEGGYKKNKKA